VVERVAGGKTDTEIADEFRAAYGDWVLLAPPLVSWGGLVWLAPLAAVAAGIALAAVRLRRESTAEPPEPDARRLAALRERVAREEAAEG